MTDEKALEEFRAEVGSIIMHDSICGDLSLSQITGFKEAEAFILRTRREAVEEAFKAVKPTKLALVDGSIFDVKLERVNFGRERFNSCINELEANMKEYLKR